MLNNDLILLPNWLEPMLAVLLNPTLNAGIVGNIQRRFEDNSIDHAGIRLTPLAQIEHRHDLDVSELAFYPVFAVTGACCLLYREDIIALGGFDERFVNGGEDVDLCLNLRTLGKSVYLASTSCILHHVSLSRGSTSLRDEQNSRLLFSKWRYWLLLEINRLWLGLLDDAIQATEFVHSMPSVPEGVPHVI